MHTEIKQATPGRCPICGMDLVHETKANSLPQPESSQDSYTPLVIIISLIALVAIVNSLPGWLNNQFSFALLLRTFMAGFFLVFAGFKLLDIKGFAQGYSTYDLLARKIIGYGYIYPFLELTLGLGYLVNAFPVATNIAAILLLTFSGIGVVQKTRSGQKIQCACLGTLLKVPLTKVTIIEDFGMAAMAIIMLTLGIN